ncbi:MAG: oligoendopeptidase F [Longibaculum muris]|uniref:Oligopeptidase F n=1 Tax=Longibaculum muris TaxID=1796628 RepID=A0A4R3YIE7_9FIRM|nr:oligoendopeptidase F [Longibaculum muris]KXU50281.1 oligoendopeptidase F [Candidatus Stoquefichus sp. KLE1796]MBS5369200.1 oligoendopeptidase F [Coprobacillus cateniformis]MCR1887115.1 oligoendopeptidase F [Longibaculum muris]MED9810837.1 oligoendopeptidase F [Longibaculum muris]TCV91986.1 oligoendopeptidase F [Longibaculum muris]
MERSSIQTKDTWDLSYIYQTNQEFYTDLQKAKDLLQVIYQQKDIFLNDVDSFLKFHEDYIKLSRYIQKLHCFAHLHCDVQPNEQDYQTMYAAILSFYDQVSSTLDFYTVMMIDHSDIITDYLKDERLADYRYSIQEILRQKKHVLSQEMETLVSKTSSISDISSQVFDALRLDYEPVHVDGEEKFLNSATLTEFLKNKNPEVRKEAYHHFFKEYKRFENVFATTLSGVMKKDAFYADVKKFANPLEASLFDDNVPTSLFFKILDKANQQYRPLFHRYNALKKKKLNLETMYNYDLSVPLIEYETKKYTIEECFDIILDVVKIFGDDYVKIIQKARDERWIDYYPHSGKRIGAYSSGCYDTKPYILMNFIGDYNSLSTMIHELGHSAHTYLSCHNQSPVNCDYRIFVAEVASTVNETLLIHYMLEHATSQEEKAYFLYELLENCVGLIFRQPMYADFEHILHTWAQEGKPMSAQMITDLYYQKNAEYFGKDVTMDEYVGYSCFYIPHFYYNYYVYKYTLGMTVALAIVSRILNGDEKQKEAYLNFLKAGGSKDPVDLLKDALVDPIDDQLYDDAFHYFENILNEFEEII